MPPKASRALHSPVTQIAVAGLVMLAGAWLVSLVVFGITVMAGGLLLGVDGLLRDLPRRSARSPEHEAVLERARRAR